MDSLELQGISLYSAFVPHLALEGLSGLGSGYQVLHKKKKETFSGIRNMRRRKKFRVEIELCGFC